MRRLIIAGIATLVIACSLFFLRSRGVLSSPTIKPDPYIGIGQVLAQETAKLIEDHGRIGVFITDYYQDKDNPLANEWNAFREELKKHPSVELAATEIIPSGEITPDTAVSYERFQELVKKHSKLNALVVFVGL